MSFELFVQCCHFGYCTCFRPMSRGSTSFSIIDMPANKKKSTVSNYNIVTDVVQTFRFSTVHNSRRIVRCWTKLITTRTVLVTRAKCANSLLTAAAYKTRHPKRTTPSHRSFSTSPLWLLLLLVTTWSREIFELHVRATNRARVSRFKSIKFHHFSLTHSLNRIGCCYVLARCLPSAPLHNIVAHRCTALLL